MVEKNLIVLQKAVRLPVLFFDAVTRRAGFWSFRASGGFSLLGSDEHGIAGGGDRHKSGWQLMC